MTRKEFHTWMSELLPRMADHGMVSPEKLLLPEDSPAIQAVLAKAYYLLKMFVSCKQTHSLLVCLVNMSQSLFMYYNLYNCHGSCGYALLCCSPGEGAAAAMGG